MGIVYGSGSSRLQSPTLLSSSIYTFNNSDIKSLIQGNNLYDRYDVDMYNKFNRFGYFSLYDNVSNTREYIFMTKPDLNLFKYGTTSSLNPDLEGIPFFEDLIKIYPETMKQLQRSHAGNTNPFMNIITNSVRSSMDLPTISIDLKETASTYQGFNIEYFGNSIESDFNPTFSLEFVDNKFLELYMLFRTIAEYERVKEDGIIKPPQLAPEADEYTISPYTLNKEIHDQWAAYKIIVDEDGQSIIYYAKTWGVKINSVPREAFGNLDDNGLKYSVEFKGSIVRDMTPDIITSFNRLVGIDGNVKDTSNDLKIYNKEKGHMNGTWAKTPYINTYDVVHNIKRGTEPIPRYKLKWR